MVIVARISGEIDFTKELLLVVFKFSDHLDVLYVPKCNEILKIIALLEAAIFLIADKLLRSVLM